MFQPRRGKDSQEEECSVLRGPPHRGQTNVIRAARDWREIPIIGGMMNSELHGKNNGQSLGSFNRVGCPNRQMTRKAGKARKGLALLLLLLLLAELKFQW